MRLFGTIVFLAIFALRGLFVLVGWQVYEATHSVFDLGLVSLVQFAGSFPIAPIAGQVSDSFSRRKIMIWALGAIVLCVGFLGYLSLSPKLPFGLMLGVLFVNSILYSFYFSASGALLPSLVEKSFLVRAVAQISLSKQLAGILGSAALGLVLQLPRGPAIGYFFLAALLAVASLASLLLPEPESQKRGAWSTSELLAGFKYFSQNSMLRGAITLDLVAVMLGGATALLPAFTKEVLGEGPEVFGILRAMPAIGAIAMAFFLSRFPLRGRIGPKLLGSVGLYGLATIAFGLSRTTEIAAVTLILVGALDMVSVVCRQTLVQIHTPDQLRGRVGAVSQMSVICSNQLGEFESGLTASLWGLVPAIVVGGAASISAMIIWAALFPQLRKLDRF